MPNRRQLLTGLALTTGAALTRSLPAPAELPARAELSGAAIARDPMRPTWHLLPARNWMNDPCGPLYWKGKYHMFFQYNPHAAVWGDMHWAHATSADMVHWRREPIALAPTPGGPDADGCFTGTAAIVDGRPAFVYTGVVKATPGDATLRDGHSNLRESQCLAVAEDDTLLHWRKQPQPIIPIPPPGMRVTGFRDPSPWQEGDDWYMVVGSGEPGVGGRVLLYKAVKQGTEAGPIAALSHWEYLHPLAEGKWSGRPGPNPVDTGEMWECPDFFPLDNKYVLIHSTEGKTIWQIGALDRATMLFHAESEGLLDYGAYYAPKTQLDAQGNRILWAFLPETRPQAQSSPQFSAAGWANLMSLPRRLSIADRQLVMEPIPQLASLRTAPRIGATVRRVPTAAQELRLTFEPSSSTPPFEQSFVDNQGAVILLRTNPQQPVGTARVGDRQITSIGNGPLDLHIFLDHSVAEIFFNHRQIITQRYYQRTSMEPAVAITLGGNWKLKQQQAWTMKSIW